MSAQIIRFPTRPEAPEPPAPPRGAAPPPPPPARTPGRRLVGNGILAALVIAGAALAWGMPLLFLVDLF